MRDYYKEAIDSIEELRSNIKANNYRMVIICSYTVAINLMRFMAEEWNPNIKAKNLTDIFIIASEILASRDRRFPDVSKYPFMYIQAMMEVIRSFYDIPVEAANESVVQLWTVINWVQSYRESVGLSVEEIQRL